MKNGLGVSAAILLGCLASAGALAGDAAAGKAKAAACAGCHGMTGVSVNPLWPNLAGQHEQYLVKQMQAFKSGTRAEPTMAAMMAALTEQDMADVAAYFSTQTCK